VDVINLSSSFVEDSIKFLTSLFGGDSDTETLLSLAFTCLEIYIKDLKINKKDKMREIIRNN